MLNILIPRARYNLADYPNLDPNYDGALIPKGVGHIVNLVPVCIDTAAQLYESLGHAIHACLQVRTPDGVVLVENTDYTLNAGKNRISLLATPYLAANTLYYLVISADFAISAANYLRLYRKDGYAGGQLFTIDGSDVWTPDAAKDLRFRIYGRESLDGAEERMVDNGWQPSTSSIALRKTSSYTRIAQSFMTGAKAFYVTRIQIFSSKVGAPSGNVQASLLSAYNPAEVQVGIASSEVAILSGYWGPRFVSFPQRATDSGIVCDIEAADKSGAMIADGADILEWIIGTELGKSTALLDAAYLADFKADRTYEMKILFNQEDMRFKTYLGTLETSLLFKLVQLLDDTYGTVVYEAGEPANTPHYRDEDFLSFSLRYEWKDIKYRVAVKYDEDASGKASSKVEEVTSDFARFFYRTEETLPVESCHHTQAGAAWLAAALSGMYEAPPLTAEFEVHGWGLDLIPARDKAKLTRTRAGYPGGNLNGVLFRILRLGKKTGTMTVVHRVQLDTQTY